MKMKPIKIYICPHPPLALEAIGNGKERGIQATIEAYKKVAQAIAWDQPDTIIYISPHGHAFRNGIAFLYGEFFTGNFRMFGFPEIIMEKSSNMALTVAMDEALRSHGYNSLLLDKYEAKYYNVDQNLDHGVMVPMYFIDQAYSDYDMVHMTPSFDSAKNHYQMGAILQKVIENTMRKVVIVASGDLSHALLEKGPYAYNKAGELFDQKVVSAVKDHNPKDLLQLEDAFIQEAAQCGLNAISTAFGLIDGYGYESEVMSYEGPFGVGYMVATLTSDGSQVAALSEKLFEEGLITDWEVTANEDDFVKLARKAIEHYILTRRKLVITECPDWMQEDVYEKLIHTRAGAFVSLHKNGELRGCIGTIEASADNLLEEIIYSAISASSSDPRFNAVEEAELGFLTISVDHLHEAQRIVDKSSLDVKKYGVIVESGRRRGLLLPNLEGVTTVDQQIEIAKQKAGIYDTHFDMYRFEVERHGGH